jgi:hypothetical protein
MKKKKELFFECLTRKDIYRLASLRRRHLKHPLFHDGQCDNIVWQMRLQEELEEILGEKKARKIPELMATLISQTIIFNEKKWSALLDAVEGKGPWPDFAETKINYL